MRPRVVEQGLEAVAHLFVEGDRECVIPGVQATVRDLEVAVVGRRFGRDGIERNGDLGERHTGTIDDVVGTRGAGVGCLVEVDSVGQTHAAGANPADTEGGIAGKDLLDGKIHRVSVRLGIVGVDSVRA